MLNSQYEQIKSTILSNVDTINALVDQAKNLAGLIEKLTDTGVDVDIRNGLEETLNNITTSIKQLIDQTNDLFDKYQRFVEDTFKNEA